MEVNHRVENQTRELRNTVMSCVCSRYNARYDWPILGLYFPIMSTGPLRPCKTKAKIGKHCMHVATAFIKFIRTFFAIPMPENNFCL